MDQIEKFLSKLEKKLAQKIVKVLLDIVALDLKTYDLEKMGGFKDHYRIRVGKIRIIFIKSNEKGLPIYIEYRGSAYKKF